MFDVDSSRVLPLFSGKSAKCGDCCLVHKPLIPCHMAQSYSPTSFNPLLSSIPASNNFSSILLFLQKVIQQKYQWLRLFQKKKKAPNDCPSSPITYWYKKKAVPCFSLPSSQFAQDPGSSSLPFLPNSNYSLSSSSFHHSSSVPAGPLSVSHSVPKSCSN